MVENFRRTNRFRASRKALYGVASVCSTPSDFLDCASAPSAKAVMIAQLSRSGLQGPRLALRAPSATCNMETKPNAALAELGVSFQ